MRFPICHCITIAATISCFVVANAASAEEPSATLPSSHVGVSARQEARQEAVPDVSSPSLPRPRLFALRLGPSFQNRIGGAFGFDITPPRWNLAPALFTRITLEGITLSRAQSSLGDLFPIGILSLDQVYQRPTGRGFRPYIGAGIGIYSGNFGTPTSYGLLGPDYRNITVFGGKLLLGADFTSTTGVEAAVHFAGSQTVGTLQLRLKL